MSVCSSERSLNEFNALFQGLLAVWVAAKHMVTPQDWQDVTAHFASSSTRWCGGPLEKACVHSVIFSLLVGSVYKKIHTLFVTQGSDWPSQVANSASGESSGCDLGRSVLWGRGDLASFLTECIVLGNGLFHWKQQHYYYLSMESIDNKWKPVWLQKWKLIPSIWGSLCSPHPPWNLNTQKPQPKLRWFWDGTGNSSHKYQQEAKTNKCGCKRVESIWSGWRQVWNERGMSPRWKVHEKIFQPLFFSWELFCSMFPENLQKSYLLYITYGLKSVFGKFS